MRATCAGGRVARPSCPAARACATTRAHPRWSCRGRSALTALAFALLSACELPEAPADLDDAARRYWRGFQGAEADELSFLAAAVDKQLRRLEADGDLPFSGEAPGGALSAADLGVLGLGPFADPSTTRGVVVAAVLPCSFERARDVLAAKNQLELYPELFRSYTRTYAGDPRAALTSTDGTASWTSVYTVDVPIYGSYTTTLFGDGRTVWGGGISGTPSDPVYLSRGYTKHPSTGGFRHSQQYNVEVVVPRGAREVYHLFAVWLDMQGIGDSVTFSEVLRRFRRIERRTSELCTSAATVPVTTP